MSTAVFLAAALLHDRPAGWPLLAAATAAIAGQAADAVSPQDARTTPEVSTDPRSITVAGTGTSGIASDATALDRLVRPPARRVHGCGANWRLGRQSTPGCACPAPVSCALAGRAGTARAPVTAFRWPARTPGWAARPGPGSAYRCVSQSPRGWPGARLRGLGARPNRHWARPGQLSRTVINAGPDWCRRWTWAADPVVRDEYR